MLQANTQLEEIDVQEPPTSAFVDPPDVSLSSNLRRSIVGSETPFRSERIVKVEEIKSSANIHLDNGMQSKFQLHPLITSTGASSEWNERTSCLCLHCCHTFSTCVVRIPHSVDNCGVYTLYPMAFCSVACAKGYLLEHNPFDAAMQLLLLQRVAMDVYGKDSSLITPAPSRLCLQIFGGNMSIQEFRDHASNHSAYDPKGVSSADTQTHGESASTTDTLIQVRHPLYTLLPMCIESKMNKARDSPGDGVMQKERDFPLIEDNGEEKGETVEASQLMVNSEWKVTELTRPTNVVVLPRAERADGTSLLQLYSECQNNGREWVAEEQDLPTTISSETPSNAQVEHAAEKVVAPEEKEARPPLVPTVVRALRAPQDCGVQTTKRNNRATRAKITPSVRPFHVKVM